MSQMNDLSESRYMPVCTSFKKNTSSVSCKTIIRGSMMLAFLGVLAACADDRNAPVEGIPAAQEAAHYRSRAKSYYAPPGPPEDPWGPYINEASTRFDVPTDWIRAVIQQESGGRLFHNGQLVTSGPGAMGLMQLMPPTYDEMRAQYSLGDDPYEPHDNIMAGTAYLRQMYDIYGTPGFLAAYNGGPGRLDDFLTHNRTLPRETRRYVLSIGRQIVGIYPKNRSQADLMVASHESGGNSYAVASSSSEAQSVSSVWAQRMAGNSSAIGSNQPLQVASAPFVSSSPSTYSSGNWGTPVRKRSNRSQVSQAWAARGYVQPQSYNVSKHSKSIKKLVHPVSARMGNVSSANQGQWTVQVGAYSSAKQAAQAAGKARSQTGTHALTQTPSIKGHGGQVYRARLTGLSRVQAQKACKTLNHCIVIAPGKSL